MEDKKNRKALGRGLRSLIEDTSLAAQPASVEEEPEEVSPARDKAGRAAQGKRAPKAPSDSIIYIKLGDIKPNATQPRSVFDEAALEDLARSISEHGVIQPVIVRPASKGYELVAGERRWRAARKAGLKTIPALVREIDDRQNALFALIENVQREDLNGIEEARGIREIMDSYGLTQEDAAKAIGKSRPYVANALRLLKLPEEVQKLVEDGKLSAGHARTIAGLKTEALQIEAAEKAVEQGWSVRQIENYAGTKTAGKKTKPRRKAKAREFSDMEERLSEAMGTKVLIDGSAKKGRVCIEYYSRDELERLIEILLEEQTGGAAR
ncbi:MAG: ParB/RepB/Spo0J family partition protein [Firmicutes bacterium]|nr:ParB/RepB/Spo0J family partition protein [Bacillota bacterium]